jgi:CO/xanthine dehydrogenase Mo-binding subunit
MADNAFRHIGQSVENIDGVAKVTGRAAYVGDICMLGLLEAKLLRSPYAHARILSIDVTRAQALPGVMAVVCGADLTGLDPYHGLIIRDQPVLAIEKVRYVGEPVAAVAAVDSRRALEALSLIDVTYDVLPDLLTMDVACAAVAPQLFERQHGGALAPDGPYGRGIKEPAGNRLCVFEYAVGDVDEAFATSDHVFEDRFRFARLSHYTLEAHATIAQPIDDGGVEIWSNNQDPFLLRADLARIFGLAPELVRVHAELVGGGFGAKSYCKMEPIAALLALRAAAPVRLVLDMDESMATLCEHEAELILKTGVMSDGTLVARQSNVRLDGGAYADASPALAEKLAQRMAGAYRWRALRGHVEVIRTTTVPAGSFRGFGNAHTCWASESQIDMIARRLRIDPLAMRRRNFIPFGEPYLPGDSGIDVDLSAGLDAVLARLGTIERRPGRGVGVAVALKGGGGLGHIGGARVTIRRDGAVTLAAGISDIGQGSRTIHQQLVAELLDLPLARVTVAPLETGQSPYDTGTHASAGLAVAGIAIRQAAEAARAELLARLSDKLGCASEDLVLEDGQVLLGDTRYDWRNLIEADIVGEGRFQVGNKTHYWMPCWCAAEVEVDRETGIVKVLRLITAIDAGLAIHPDQCHGQALGAAVQGIGQALTEDATCLGTDQPALTPWRYRVPLAGDIPRIETLVLEQGHGPGPFGSKGVGEAGNLPVPAAIANAIADACGARITNLPFTPERVLAAIDAVPA